MIYHQQLQLHWLDENNARCSQVYHTLQNPPPALGTAGLFVSAAQSLSVAGLQAVWLTPCEQVLAAPGAGPYGNRDKAQFTFRTADRTIVRMNIPAPKASIFLGDAETVDLENPLVVGFLNAAMAAMGSSGGSALVAVTSAVRTRVRA